MKEKNRFFKIVVIHIQLEEKEKTRGGWWHTRGGVGGRESEEPKCRSDDG